ncbi:nucleotide-binding universal stress UspA family protein [Prauserella shujinwangii]|uniref:Nucleotide-binding universal stress UspA family protein n=1 Tax=Prauserella shujinwangii TaxID=1453103 RepID=A0A2T0LRR3_9PSEU|nr:universal stress protein [Prauserella shujinwangii]PRX46186.1 nucleotide-binding universal stress UspA family protein [Prauserella shujinwangii]
MPIVAQVILLAALWVLVGLTSVAFILGRQGHRDWRWYVVGGVLGLLFVPIAVERATRRTTVLERSPSDGGTEGEGVTVLVGVDGSAESDEAVRDTARLFGGTAGRVVLVAAADPDVGEFDLAEPQQRCHDLLADRAAWLPRHVTVVTEVVAGQPARVLLERARTEHADLVVLGRRGSGLSPRLLGSVATLVTKRSPEPVLLAGRPRAGQEREPEAEAVGAATSG